MFHRKSLMAALAAITLFGAATASAEAATISQTGTGTTTGWFRQNSSADATLFAAISPDTAPPTVPSDTSNGAFSSTNNSELHVALGTHVAGDVVVSAYGRTPSTRPATVRLYSGGVQVATASFTADGVNRWTSTAPTAVAATDNLEVVVKAGSGSGTSRLFAVHADVTAATPPPTPPTAFPDASNTGVPTGTTLTEYTGPMTITDDNTVIDGKTINGNLVIGSGANNVVIKNSKINGYVEAEYCSCDVTIQDSEIDGGQNSHAAVGFADITLKRVEVTGARVSVLCQDRCSIEDSWLHAQYLDPSSDWHVNGYVSNGGGNVLVKHNTIACDTPDNAFGGGCTGPGASFGDFDVIHDVTYDGNLFKAGPGAYCLSAGHNSAKPFGSNPTNVDVLNNVFERGASGTCGYAGFVTSFKASDSTSSWTNNKDDAGNTVVSADE